MKGILIWFAALGLLVSLLGLWVAAHDPQPAEPESPGIHTEAMEPELPAVPEIQPELDAIIPLVTF